MSINRSISQQDYRVKYIYVEVRQLKKALGTLIAWLPESANSPIRKDEAMRLLNILEGHE